MSPNQPTTLTVKAVAHWNSGSETTANSDFDSLTRISSGSNTKSLQKKAGELKSPNTKQPGILSVESRIQTQAIQALARVSETRDLYTFSHQRRVAYLAKHIASQMLLYPDQVEGIYFAGLLHDIGKIGVPGEILCKTSKLNIDEVRLVRRHCEIGYHILKDIEFTWPIALAALQHHERLDGSGYPQSLTAKDIILEAKIVAIADVVEAMASARPYRPMMGVAYALNEIVSKQGTVYEKAVVAACVDLFSAGFRLNSVDKFSSF